MKHLLIGVSSIMVMAMLSGCIDPAYLLDDDSRQENSADITPSPASSPPPPIYVPAPAAPMPVPVPPPAYSDPYASVLDWCYKHPPSFKWEHAPESWWHDDVLADRDDPNWQKWRECHDILKHGHPVIDGL
jgi:hypothetical protein